MKKGIICGLLVAMAVISGCATSTELIKTGSISTRSDVFQELTDGGLVPQGYADLQVTSSLKTHNPGVYSTKDIHGTADYRLLLNIDGQAVQIQGSLHEENIEQKVLRDDEAGEGIRYLFEKKLRLKAGTHKIVIAIPADDLAVEREITLPEGSSNSLVVEPIYRGAPIKRRPGFYGIKSFKEGIRGLWVTLNSKQI